MERSYVGADVAVIIGRFQVPALHAGHEEILDWMLSHYPRVVVALGVPEVPVQRNNPLDFEARFLMLQMFARSREKKMTVVPLPDHRSNEVWSAALDKVVRSMLAPGQKVVLCGSRDSFISAYTGTSPFRSCEATPSIGAVRRCGKLLGRSYTTAPTSVPG